MSPRIFTNNPEAAWPACEAQAVNLRSRALRAGRIDRGTVEPHLVSGYDLSRTELVQNVESARERT